MGAKARVGEKSDAADQDALPRSPEEALGSQLRGLFEHVASQPVPDRIGDLVEALEARRLAEDEAAELDAPEF